MGAWNPPDRAYATTIRRTSNRLLSAPVGPRSRPDDGENRRDVRTRPLSGTRGKFSSFFRSSRRFPISRPHSPLRARIGIPKYCQNAVAHYCDPSPTSIADEEVVEGEIGGKVWWMLEDVRPSREGKRHLVGGHFGRRVAKLLWRIQMDVPEGLVARSAF